MDKRGGRLSTKEIVDLHVLHPEDFFTQQQVFNLHP